LQEIIAQHCAANFPFRGLQSKLSTHLIVFLPLVFRTTTIRQENQNIEFWLTIAYCEATWTFCKRAAEAPRQ
jgi:hypothetical protein